MASGTEAAQKGPSVAWYIVPILFGIIGGLIMYFAIRHRDPGMAQKGFLVGILIFIASIALGAATVFFGGALFESERLAAQAGSITLSNVNLWVSPDGRSAGALVVTNQGTEPVVINAVKVRGVSLPYGTWHYNKVDAVPSNINTPLRPDYTPSLVNVDMDAMEEPFTPAIQPVILEGSQSVILYLSNLQYVQSGDVGNVYAVSIQTGYETKSASVAVVSAAG